MAEVIVYVTAYCPYCHAAKEFLADKGVSFTEIDVTGNSAERASLVTRERNGGRPIGGYDDIMALEREGALDRLLEAS